VGSSPEKILKKKRKEHLLLLLLHRSSLAFARYTYLSSEREICENGSLFFANGVEICRFEGGYEWREELLFCSRRDRRSSILFVFFARCLRRRDEKRRWRVESDVRGCGGDGDDEEGKSRR